METDKIQKRLYNVLNEKRYNHSIGVMREAVRMAEMFGEDRDKACVAGLLHDCAKYLSTDEAIAIAKKYNVKLDEDTLNCPSVIHAPIGAIIARYEYGISDEEILKAIENHTVAGRGMTNLCKIIYVADMTESGREFPGVEDLRKKSCISLDDAYKTALKLSLEHNLNKNGYIHPMTIYAWNELNKGGKRE